MTPVTDPAVLQARFAARTGWDEADLLALALNFLGERGALLGDFERFLEIAARDQDPQYSVGERVRVTRPGVFTDIDRVPVPVGAVGEVVALHPGEQEYDVAFPEGLAVFGFTGAVQFLGGADGPGVPGPDAPGDARPDARPPPTYRLSIIVDTADAAWQESGLPDSDQLARFVHGIATAIALGRFDLDRGGRVALPDANGNYACRAELEVGSP